MSNKNLYIFPSLINSRSVKINMNENIIFSFLKKFYEKIIFKSNFKQLEKMNYTNKTLANYSLNTPILFCIFSRPEVTRHVFEMIRKAKPPRLYISCDGPRKNFPVEKKMIDMTKKIVSNIDWPCKVKRLYRKKNLGCKKAMSSGISWFFKHEECGIILEDDCLPNLDFFFFCEKMLKRFRNKKEIFTITGNNFVSDKINFKNSYYFSKYFQCWGWATWRSRWKFYQGNLNFWPKFKQSDEWKNLMHYKNEKDYWNEIFNLVYNNKIDSWAYPWTCCIMYYKGLTVTPKVNLVTNIGFNQSATHTKQQLKNISYLKAESIGKLKNNFKIKQDDVVDKMQFDLRYYEKNASIFDKITSLPERILKKIYFKILKFLKKN
jgi:hypothetical protein